MKNRGKRLKISTFEDSSKNILPYNYFYNVTLEKLNKVIREVIYKNEQKNT